LYAQLIKGKAAQIGVHLCLLIVTICFQLPIPFLVSNLIDGFYNEIDSNKFYLNIGGILGLSTLAILATVIVQIHDAALKKQFVVSARLAIFSALQRSSPRFVREFNPTDTFTRLTNDIGTFNFLMPTGLASVVSNLLYMFALGGILIYTSFELVLYLIGFLPLSIFIFKYARGRLSQLSLRAQEGLSSANITTRESIASLLESKITGSQAFYLARFEDGMEESENRMYHVSRYSVLMLGMLGTIPVMVSAIVWLVGGLQVDASHLTVGQLVSFMLIMTMLYRPIDGLFSASSEFVYEMEAFKRVAKLVDPAIELLPERVSSSTIIQNGARSDLGLPISVALDGVTFHYNDTVIFDNLNASIQAGSCTSLLGPNGSGKSTLGLILTGLECPLLGKVSLNGVALDSIGEENYMGFYGYLPQSVFIFSGSLRQNISVGRQVSDNQIQSLLLELGWNYLLESNHKLDTEILESGRDLSGGERQKIGLLRTLVNNPSILVLDEPENNLDKASLDGLVSYLEKKKGTTTVILITHCTDFDKIFDQSIYLPLHEKAVKSGSVA